MSERASEAEREYWRRLAEASERLRADESPPDSLAEVFRRMDSIRERLGILATPGLPADDDAALAENVRLRARFLAKSPRSNPRS